MERGAWSVKRYIVTALTKTNSSIRFHLPQQPRGPTVLQIYKNLFFGQVQKMRFIENDPADRFCSIEPELFRTYFVRHAMYSVSKYDQAKTLDKCIASWFDLVSSSFFGF